MSSDYSSDYEMETHSDSPTEERAPRRPHKSGRHVREEPTTLTKLQACPFSVSCFRFQSCYEFCEKVANVQFYHELARLFVLHLYGAQVTLAGVTFTLTLESISLATGMPKIGEPWTKRQKVDRQHYKPYVKLAFLRQLKRVFPFRYLKNEYAPLTKLIMKYFSCEGRFSRLYAYHIRLLMHFTQVCMMNIPYFICRNIERMTALVQHKTPEQQFNSICHFALVKILVVPQLDLHGITWDDFISRDFFRASQGPSETRFEIGEPSH